MQILQWVSKGAHEQEIWRSTISSPTNWKAIKEEKAKGKDIITLKHHKAYRRTKRIEGRKLGSKNLKLFPFICGKDIPKACFYRTLKVKEIENLNMRRHFVNSVKMKREELSKGIGITRKADFATHGGKKVLPITEASFSDSPKRNDQRVIAESNAVTKKPVSRMKQLLRKVAAAKTEKSEKFYEQKVLQFRRQGNVEAVQDHDELSSESPKISFTWDVETCLSENGQAQISRSQVFIPPSERDRRKGNWITTDSEYVVLEL
ncbi:uncharacterized protein LOC113850341 isoform X2 [Abrus precatorius]|uniref:Uncharacterized protein LOC113850341 isoform X2 n=1 Tax=Abrus precatorius TaxID=3816 RepID=A0A8B8JZF7_ABRPR|nr:uncharacterized protein LOC113850341 isoform X2 [Abrus precatorius]